jgi:hypothetical protein
MSVRRVNRSSSISAVEKNTYYHINISVDRTNYDEGYFFDRIEKCLTNDYFNELTRNDGKLTITRYFSSNAFSHKVEMAIFFEKHRSYIMLPFLNIRLAVKDCLSSDGNSSKKAPSIKITPLKEKEYNILYKEYTDFNEEKDIIEGVDKVLEKIDG